jgi:hypothetical protein
MGRARFQVRGLPVGPPPPGPGPACTAGALVGRGVWSWVAAAAGPGVTYQELESTGRGRISKVGSAYSCIFCI